MALDPENKTGHEVLDGVFAGALPLIRGPVQVIEGEPNEVGPAKLALVMNDGDHLFTNGHVLMAEAALYKFLEYAINRAYDDWQGLVRPMGADLTRKSD